jgi:hypothetical protein
LLDEVDGVFGHGTVGGPLSAKDADQAGAGVEFDFVVANELLGVMSARGPNQGTNAGERADDLVDAARRGDVAVEMADEVIGFGAGNGRWVDRGDFVIGRTDKQTAKPGDGEENAAIFRLGDEEGGALGVGVEWEEDVDAAAERETWGEIGIRKEAHRVGERSGGVHEDSGAERNGIAGKGIADLGGGQYALLITVKGDEAAMVGDGASGLGKRF